MIILLTAKLIGIHLYDTWDSLDHLAEGVLWKPLALCSLQTFHMAQIMMGDEQHVPDIMANSQSQLG